MKLVSILVENYRSIENSTEFKIGDVTCLVGKNEAGKSALLTALHQLRPYGEPEKEYDKVVDYPRRFRAKYAERHGGKEARVCETKWEISESELSKLTTEFYGDCFSSREVIISKFYGSKSARWTIPIREDYILSNLIKVYRFDAIESAPLNGCNDTSEAIKILESIEQRSDKQNSLLGKLKTYPAGRAISRAKDILDATTPKFKLFSHFDRMSGQISIEKTLSDRNNETLSRGDSIFLQFLEYAGTDLSDLSKADRYEELKSECESASNRLTDQIFNYWTQNVALEVEVDVSPGRPADPPPFNTGTVIRARVRNSYHRASVPFSERSAGFVWFFSFLVEFTQIKKEHGNVIILLDEPGLTLHGKAQRDLLDYVYAELKPHHQVLFTTHSPFLIPADDLGSVRIVEDVIDRRNSDKGRIEVLGTKVRADVMATDKDTLFPLQGAMGYDIAQSLFIGKNTILVEGPSDILFIKAASRAIVQLGGTGLDPRWVICPSGGIDKIQPFISLFGGNGINVAVLTDHGDNDRKRIENIKKSEILQTSHFYTTSDFVSQDTSDVEDIFGADAYIDIINLAYAGDEGIPITKEFLSKVSPQSERIVKMTEGAFRIMPNARNFDHFFPASWLIEHPSATTKVLKKYGDARKRFENLFQTFNSLLK